ncbi:AraC family transcriptional regulator [bacterium]|nr:MAG: AraC family transcriptional regulator [bacterium]
MPNRPDRSLAQMKSLESLLPSLRLRSKIQNRVVVSEPWGVLFPPLSKAGMLHFMEFGRGVLEVPGFPPVLMEQGDFAIVFAESSHAVHDVGGSEPRPLDELMKKADVICRTGLTLRFGGTGKEASVLTGDFQFADSANHPIWRLLPPYILLRGEDGQAVDWIDTTLSLLSREAMDARAGMTTVLDRLCDVLFIQALRGWVRTDLAEDGLAAAVRDPAIDEALDRMQRFPQNAWTVESLAAHVALSRSSFADRFRRLTGETPIEYLTHWRMHLATQSLAEGQASTATVAEEVGYESEAAFAKAFKRTVGVSPGAFRRGARSGML